MRYTIYYQIWVTNKSSRNENTIRGKCIYFKFNDDLRFSFRSSLAIPVISIDKGSSCASPASLEHDTIHLPPLKGVRVELKGQIGHCCVRPEMVWLWVGAYNAGMEKLLTHMNPPIVRNDLPLGTTAANVRPKPSGMDGPDDQDMVARSRMPVSLPGFLPRVTTKWVASPSGVLTWNWFRTLFRRSALSLYVFIQ